MLAMLMHIKYGLKDSSNPSEVLYIILYIEQVLNCEQKYSQEPRADHSFLLTPKFEDDLSNKARPIAAKAPGVRTLFSRIYRKLRIRLQTSR